MGYVKQLFGRAWFETWGVIFSSPLVSVIAAVFIFGISLLIHWQRKGVGEVKDALVIAAEGATATLIVFIAVFVFHLLFLTPKRLYTSARSQATELQTQLSRREEPRVRLDVTDTEGRAQIESLSKRLDEAYATIGRQQLELDPLSKPIAAARFTVRIIFKEKKEGAATHMS